MLCVKLLSQITSSLISNFILIWRSHAQTWAEEILMGSETFTDLVVGAWNGMSTFCWDMKKVMKMKFL